MIVVVVLSAVLFDLILDEYGCMLSNRHVRKRFNKTTYRSDSVGLDRDFPEAVDESCVRAMKSRVSVPSYLPSFAKSVAFLSTHARRRNRSYVLYIYYLYTNYALR